MKAEHERSAGTGRREFLRATGSTAGLAFAACATGTPQHRGQEAPKEAEVTPGEDLMQEHGVLERVLLIYEEVARRIDVGDRFDLETVDRAAGIIRRFIEDYHEKNEEQFVFPRLQSAGRETELVAVLLSQHRRGREVTEHIMRAAKGTTGYDLAKLLRGFSRMYRPHAAREDTVVFPAFRATMGRQAYRDLGEEFEDREHQLLGAHGLEDTVADVARLETTLGIGDLAKLTMP